MDPCYFPHASLVGLQAPLGFRPAAYIAKKPKKDKKDKKDKKAKKAKKAKKSKHRRERHDSDNEDDVAQPRRDDGTYAHQTQVLPPAHSLTVFVSRSRACASSGSKSQSLTETKT